MKRLIILAILTLSACATEQQRIEQLAAAKCPNGANDWDAYRDASGRLHVDVGCD